MYNKRFQDNKKVNQQKASEVKTLTGQKKKIWKKVYSKKYVNIKKENASPCKTALSSIPLSQVNEFEYYIQG